jgi:Protein of unknown function (DUF3159)
VTPGPGTPGPGTPGPGTPGLGTPGPGTPVGDAAPPEVPPEPAVPTILDRMGGLPGIVASSIPVMVFVVANLLFELRSAVIAAVVSGVGIAGWRVVRRQPLQPAVSGLFGVGVAAFLAYRSGEARAFYLPGLIYSAVCGLAFLVSVPARWPLAGVIWHGINGDGQGWRRDRHLLRAYSWASLLWALVFGARVVVQGWLYRVQEETWLGIARLAMGYPLVGVALLGTVWAVRRARRVAQPAG